MTLVPAELYGIPGGLTKAGSTTIDGVQSSGRAVTVIRSFVNGIVTYPVGEIMQLKQKVSTKPRRFVPIPEIENNGDGPITTFDYGAKLVPQPGSLNEHEVTGQSDYRV